MISKELLSLVLDKNVTKVEYCVVGSRGQSVDYTRLSVSIDIKNTEYINLDTLTRLMKEWCLTKGYEVSSRLDLVTKATAIVWLKFRECVVENGDNEYEVVEKVTQWVAKENNFLIVRGG